MPSFVRFTPLLGTEDEGPVCHLLEIDGFRILLDCGWDETFNEAHLDPLKRVAKIVDAVLISHPDLKHIGALPYVISKMGLDCPIYTTQPVFNMGLMSLYESVLSRQKRDDFDTLTFSDIDEAFDEKRWVIIKYSQRYSLPGRGKGITVTPYLAGHLVGGSIWMINKDTDEIIYAMHINHKRERHLDGNKIEDLTKPSLMITDAYNSGVKEEVKQQRESNLLNIIKSTLSKGGDVLMPVDASGRVLELSLFLEQSWDLNLLDMRRLDYKIFILSYHGQNVFFKYAQTMTEWMSKDVNPNDVSAFAFKYVKCVDKMDEIEACKQPKIVLATTETLETGFARDLLALWGTNPLNTVVLTSRGSPGSFVRMLLENPDKREFHNFEVKKRVELEGTELAEYQLKKSKEESVIANQTAVMEDVDNDEDEMETDMRDTVQKFDVILKDNSRSVGFFKQSRHFPIFPFFDYRPKCDEYGEFVREEDFSTLEEVGNVKQPEVKTEEVVKVETPTKCILETIHLNITCNIHFINFEGLSDGDSIIGFLSIIQPKKLILVGGTKTKNENMASALRRIISEKDQNLTLLTPSGSETLDVSSTTDIRQVTLTDSLVSSLKTFQKGDYELSYFKAKFSEAEEDVLEPMDESEDNREPIFVGEVKLAQFLQILQKAGFDAKFSKQKGVLICNNQVGIRKMETGKLMIEGVLSETYFKVRELLYEQFAIL